MVLSFLPPARKLSIAIKHSFLCRLVVVVALFIGFINGASAQIVSYTTATSGALNTVATNATGTTLSRVNGATLPGSICGTGFSSSTFSTATTYSTSLAAVEVSATPNVGYALNVTGFSADLRRSTTGPASLRFAYSTNGGATWTDQGSNQTDPSASCGAGSTLTWTTSFSVNAPNSLKFRIYGFNASSTSGTEQILNLLINGTVTAVSSCTPPTLAATPTNVLCNGSSTGAVTLTTNGGTGPFTFLWSNSATTQSISNVAANSYSVTVTATGGCTATASATVSQPSSPLSASITSITNAACGAGSGSLTVTPTGGTPGYTYHWNTVPIQTTAIASGLSVGSYNVVVTDANNCTASVPDSINLLSPLGLTATGISSSSATLSWTPVTGALSYNIRYRMTGTLTWITTSSGSASLFISGLTAGTSYEFQVQTVCASGSSGFSGSGTFNTTGSTSCPVPVALAGSNITGATAQLNWAVALGGISYNIQYRIVGTLPWTSVSSSHNSVVVTGLTNNTTYEFQVQTVCSNGTSNFSVSQKFVTGAGCGTPTVSPVNTFGSTTATFKWVAVSGATSYNIRYRKVGTTTWSTATSITDSLAVTGLLASTNYAFQVQAVCSGGVTGNFSTSGTFTTTSGGSCGIASGLAVTNITGTSATLGWTAVSGATSYNIQYRQTGTLTWTSTSSSTNSKSITGLTSGLTYEFQVQTVCTGGGTSAFTASVTFTTTGSVCGTPTGITVSNVTSSSGLMTWTPVTGAVRYNVQYRDSGSSTWITDTASANTYAIVGLTSSTAIQFQVQTVCANGTSAFTSTFTFTTLGPCGSAPVGFVVVNITSTSAVIDWTAVVGASSYKIQYRKAGTNTWTSTTSSTNSKPISGLIAGTVYEFEVQSVCPGNLTSPFSALSNFATAAILPRPDHIVVLIEENHSYSDIIGSSSAPHINALLSDTNCAWFTHSYAIEHPSQPNYLDLFSGSDQGMTSDNLPGTFPFTTPNLGHGLIDSAHTFITYSEDLPSVGYNGATSGNYARKHNPGANWMGTGTNGIPTTTNQPFTSFPTSANYASLPTVCYVVPNLQDDMHTGTIQAGDTWYYTNIYPYVQWAETHNSLLIITWDEDDLSANNQIPTLFAGQMVKAGADTTQIDHYKLLRTIEDMYKLPYCDSDAARSPITNCWKTVNTTAPLYCDSTLWDHVYHSYRLIIHDTCTYVTGTVDALLYEADGDIHIRLNLDTIWKPLLNSVNISGQYGDLVCEPVCATTVTQTDAISACQGFTNTVFIPAVGEHIKVTGSYVTDNDHGWNEIHPVTSIVITTQTQRPVLGVTAGINDEIDDDYIALKVFPNPATDIINFRLLQKPLSVVKIQIMDELGRSAGQYQMLEANNLEITTTYLPEGMYYYNIIQGDRVMNTGKFVVVH